MKFLSPFLLVFLTISAPLFATVSTTTARTVATGNDTTLTYPYTYKIFSDSDLEVIIRDTSNVETTLTKTTHYTVTGVGVSSGGNVVLVNGAFSWISLGGHLSTGYVISIRRKMAETQLTSLRNQGAYYPSLHENAFDKLTYLVQQIQDPIDRSLQAPWGDSAVSLTLPLATNRASKFLAFDSIGAAIASPGIPSVPTTAFTATFLLSANAAAAVTALGLPSFPASGTSGGILGYTSTGGLASSAALTANQLIVGGGAGATPATLAAGSQYQSLVMGASTPAYGAIPLNQSAAISGQLPVASGGTGAATLTGLLKGNGTSPITALTTLAGSTFLTIPVSQAFTSGTGATYARSANSLYTHCRLVGPGGGGGSTGTSGAANGTDAADSSFVIPILGTVTAGGGKHGAVGTASSSGAGGVGGTPSGSQNIDAIAGGAGNSALLLSTGGPTANSQIPGGTGGVSCKGGGGSATTGNGQNGASNSGSGGGGGAGNGSTYAAGGGGAGACIEFILPGLGGTYTIGAKGTGATAGTSGNAGGDGGSSELVCIDYFQ